MFCPKLKTLDEDDDICLQWPVYYSLLHQHCALMPSGGHVELSKVKHTDKTTACVITFMSLPVLCYSQVLYNTCSRKDQKSQPALNALNDQMQDSYPVNQAGILGKHL